MKHSLKPQSEKKRNQKLDLDETNKKRKIKIITPALVVLATYILLLFSKIIDLKILNRENEYYTVVILQLLIFLLPAAVWCIYRGEGYTKRLRMRLPRPSSFLLIISATLLMISGGLFLSFIFGGLDSLSKNFSLYDTFISKSDSSIQSNVYLLLAYAVLPAICEEVVYRGILCAEYEKGGVARSIIFSSVFFALLHFNPINILTYLFSGAVLALVLYASRSLFAAMLTHFFYNIFGLFGQKYMNTLYKITGSEIFFVFIITFILLLSAALFCRQASKLYKKHLYEGVSSNYRKPVSKTPEEIRASFLEVLTEPATVICVIFYIGVSIFYLVR